MLKSAVRGLEWCTSFGVAARNCGIRSAFVIFILARRSTARRTVGIKRLDRAKITFRGRRDYGVLTHFFAPSYRIQATARQVRWIVDAGANIGDETLKFRAFHPEAQIVAIEPDPENADLLRINFAGDSHVHIEEKALWPRAGETLRLSRGRSPEQAQVTNEGEGPPVVSTSFEEICDTYQIERLDIVKLDIEGAERELLVSQATDWLSLVDVVVMEVADHESPGGLQRLLRAMPFEVDCQIIGENVVAVRRGCGLSAESYKYL